MAASFENDTALLIIKNLFELYDRYEQASCRNDLSALNN